MALAIGLDQDLTRQVVCLGIWSDQTLSRHTLLFCNAALIVAKRDVIRLWGSEEIPTIDKWGHNMDWCMQAEEVAYEASEMCKSVGSLERTAGPYLDTLQGKT